MAEVFTILDNGEELITGEWVPPPSDVAARMVGLAHYYDNMFVPLGEIRQAAIEKTRGHFEDQENPQKVPWDALSDWTLKDKRKQTSAFPEAILRMTGAGYEAATSEHAWMITEDAVWFNPEVMPGYMTYHQSGTLHGGVAEALGRVQSKAQTAGDAETLTQHYGRGKGLPQREFIGFDEYDTLDFEAIFDAWFEAPLHFIDDGVEIIPTGYNMLGEFPILSFTKTGQPILRTPFGPRFGRVR